MNRAPRPHQSSVDQGRIEALSHAIATLVKMQPPAIKKEIVEALSQNFKMGEDMSLNLTVSDEWRAGLVGEGERLLKLIEGSNPA